MRTMVYYSPDGPWREESLARDLEELGEPPEIPAHINDKLSAPSELESIVGCETDIIESDEQNKRKNLVSKKICLFNQQKNYLYLALASTIPLFLTAYAGYKQIEDSKNYVGGAILLMIGGILAYIDKCSEVKRKIANYYLE